MEDRQFMIQFVSVIGGLVVIGVICIILANWLGTKPDDPSDPFTSQVIEERIKPVGEVYVGSVPAEALTKAKQAAVPTATKSAFADGKGVYDSVCLACHSTGVAGAPKYGEKDAWAKYLGKGVEGNYAAAINGVGAMPPKGGRMDLSEGDVKSAVDYMLEALN